VPLAHDVQRSPVPTRTGLPVEQELSHVRLGEPLRVGRRDLAQPAQGACVEVDDAKVAPESRPRARAIEWLQVLEVGLRGRQERATLSREIEPIPDAVTSRGLVPDLVLGVGFMFASMAAVSCPILTAAR
jgi:hypothetical protein